MSQTVLESLNRGLLSAMQSDDSVLLLGEDILDPYGGAFKVTRGCSTAYPSRVLTTPISEAGLAGVAAGMALRGLRPVLEIMFGDFTTLIADQLINHISKFRWMYNNTVNLPLVIRAPMGGRRGYGPTHSQTLEKHFLGIPGLSVLAPVHLSTGEAGDTPGDLLRAAILQTHDPVLFVENKLQYLLSIHAAAELSDFELERSWTMLEGQVPAPQYRLRVKGAPTPVVTLAAYGYMAELARQAMLRLAYEQEVFTELVIPTRLAPFDLDGILDSTARTGRLVTIEEGGGTLGWGAEVLARVSESGVPVTSKRVAALDLPIAAAPALEKSILPQVEDIFSAVRKVVNR